ELLAAANPTVAECGPPNCGDGKLDADEVCDGVFSTCLPTCVFANGFEMHECNPVTGLGCDSGYCTLQQDEDGFRLWFGCPDFTSGTPSVENGGACTSTGQCLDPSAICMYRSKCGGSCCVETCYLGPTDEESFGCAAGTTCTPVTQNAPELWQQNSDAFG